MKFKNEKVALEAQAQVNSELTARGFDVQFDVINDSYEVTAEKFRSTYEIADQMTTMLGEDANPFNILSEQVCQTQEYEEYISASANTEVSSNKRDNDKDEAISDDEINKALNKIGITEVDGVPVYYSAIITSRFVHENASQQGKEQAAIDKQMTEIILHGTLSDKKENKFIIATVVNVGGAHYEACLINFDKENKLADIQIVNSIDTKNVSGNEKEFDMLKDVLISLGYRNVNLEYKLGIMQEKNHDCGIASIQNLQSILNNPKSRANMVFSNTAVAAAAATVSETNPLIDNFKEILGMSPEDAQEAANIAKRLNPNRSDEELLQWVMNNGGTEENKMECLRRRLKP